MLATPLGQPVDDLNLNPRLERGKGSGTLRGGCGAAADCGTFDPWAKVAISKNNTNKAATTTYSHTHTHTERQTQTHKLRMAATP